MSRIFFPNPLSGEKCNGDENTVSDMLRENAALIHAIKDAQNDGCADKMLDYMKLLHRNLLWLSLLADSTKNSNSSGE
ncbi:unnamed protein product, partial [Didymodactylos carnosus]